MEPTRLAPQTLETIFAHQRPDAILFYSRQTAEDFFRTIKAHMSPDGLAGMRFLCLSKSVAEAVPAPLQSATSIARMPEERSLLSLL
jgi:uroporphyrinogen-III synthase